MGICFSSEEVCRWRRGSGEMKVALTQEQRAQAYKGEPFTDHLRADPQSHGETAAISCMEIASWLCDPGGPRSWMTGSRCWCLPEHSHFLCVVYGCVAYRGRAEKLQQRQLRAHKAKISGLLQKMFTKPWSTRQKGSCFIQLNVGTGSRRVVNND